MVIIFTKEAEKDLKYWIKTKNLSAQSRISELLTEIKTNPYSGIGNPEQLKHDLSGFWSRRINKEHRIVYRVLDDKIEVISLRFHY
jgi:toxin YoeB